MKKLTLLFALLAFAVTGCTEETEIETPDADDVVVEDADVVGGMIDAEVDSLQGAVEAGADATEDAVDAATDGDADGDGH